MTQMSERIDRAECDSLDENALVGALRNGADGGYECLVRRYGGRMLATARRLLRGEADARDCVQDAFLSAFKNMSQFEQRASIATWLHQIVVNTALMKIRRRTRRKEESLDELMPEFDGQSRRPEPHATDVPFESLLESREIRNLVRQSIDRLPENYRIVLMLRDIEGYDTEETAALIGASPGAVKTQLHRARAALKKLLEPILRGEEP